MVITMAIPNRIAGMPPVRYDDVMELRGARIRTARRHAHLSQEELAARMGVSQALVSQWENGKKALSADQVVNLARELGTTVGYLLYGTELTEQPANSSLSPHGGTVPMVDIADAVMRRAPNAQAQRITPSFPCSSESYWFFLPDDSNAPDYPRGARAVWDPQGRPQPGSMVLAIHGETGQPIIGELSYETSAHGKVTVVRPLNVRWPAARSDLEPVEIVSTMTEIIKRVSV